MSARDEAEVLKSIAPSLEELGLARLSATTWSKPLSSDAKFWLGANTASMGDRIEVNPVVGVIYEPVERAWRSLAELRSGPLRSPTIFRSLGYVTPAATYIGWYFSKRGLQMDSRGPLREAILRYGLPFAEKYASLENIEDALNQGWSSGREHGIGRLVAVATLTRDPKKYRKYSSLATQAISGRNDAAAAQLRTVITNASKALESL